MLEIDCYDHRSVCGQPNPRVGSVFWLYGTIYIPPGQEYKITVGGETITRVEEEFQVIEEFSHYGIVTAVDMPNKQLTAFVPTYENQYITLVSKDRWSWNNGKDFNDNDYRSAMWLKHKDEEEMRPEDFTWE